MTARDILERGRAARVRLRAIDAELEIRRSKVGPQGHDAGYHAKDFIADPMDAVLSLIEATEDMDAERVGLQADMEDARQLLRGVAKGVSEQLAMILELHYLDGLTPQAVARRMHYPSELTERAIRYSPDELTPLLPRLMQCGKE